MYLYRARNGPFFSNYCIIHFGLVNNYRHGGRWQDFENLCDAILMVFR